MLNRILNVSAEDCATFVFKVCFTAAAGLGPADGKAEFLLAVRFWPPIGSFAAFPDVIFSVIIVAKHKDVIER